MPLKDVNKLIREIYSIKPYKFEDLKADMYLYDIKKNEIIYLFKPLNRDPTKGLRYSYGKIKTTLHMDFIWILKKIAFIQCKWRMRGVSDV